MSTTGTASTFALNCWVLGIQPNDVFTVKISKNDNVSALKDAIKERKQQAFQFVDADNLKLWPVPTAIPVDDNIEKRVNGLDLTKPPRSVRPLAGLFAEPLEPLNLHVVIKVPDDGIHSETTSCILS
jgi:Crinkler effector protein N-terminal domain